MIDRIYRSGAKGTNLQGVREALNPLDKHIAVAVVKGDGDGDHFDILGGNIWIEVVLVPDETPISCRLCTVAGSRGAGVWRIPSEGTEVVVAFPDGGMLSGGLIIGVLPGGNAPQAEQDKFLVIAPQVLIYDSGQGNAKELVTMAEFRGHTHGTGTGPSGPTIDPIPGVGPITGTTVLKAE